MINTLATFLFAAAWKGTLLVAFALLVHRLARNRVPSRWLCALLFVAIVRLLVPVAPATSFSVFNLVPARTGAPAPSQMDEAPVRRARVAAARPIAPPPAPPTSRWIPALLALWGAGVLIAIARAALQTRRFRRQLAASIDVDRDDVTALVDECREILNVRRRVRIVTTSAVATPSLHGWMQPALLLPDGFLVAFTREQLRYVVLHELAHLRRSDVLVNWIATAAQALHWFNPLVRLAVARLAEERELACDALALAALRAEERPAYGGTVLEVLCLQTSIRMRATPVVANAVAVPALVGMTATPEQLKRRIVMIASFRPNRFSIVFAALVVAVGLVTLTDARAGELKVIREKMRQPASPAVQAVLQKLETKIDAELTSASVDDVLHTIMNATGISIAIEDGAVDDATRAKRLQLSAINVPAHLVLIESLDTLGLGVKFTETGVVVQKLEPGEAMLMRRADNEVMRSRVRRSAEEIGQGVEGGVPGGVAGGVAGGVEGGVEEGAIVRKVIEATGSGEPGDGKRKLTLRDGDEVGTLSIEVVKNR